MFACSISNTRSSIETVYALLAHPHIDVNLQIHEGWSALMFASAESNTTSSIETPDS